MAVRNIPALLLIISSIEFRFLAEANASLNGRPAIQWTFYYTNVQFNFLLSFVTPTRLGGMLIHTMAVDMNNILSGYRWPLWQSVNFISSDRSVLHVRFICKLLPQPRQNSLLVLHARSPDE